MLRRFGVTILYIVSLTAHADSTSDLMECLGFEQDASDIRGAIVSEMAGVNANMLRKEQIINAWAESYLSWQEIKPRIVELYRSNFSDQELQVIAQFCTSQAGAKFLESMPLLRMERAQVAVEIAKLRESELREMLRTEAVRK